ncbi:MAG: hypothetical protein ACI9I8_001125 [Cellvibrionaceae bacterium]|jgi:hypothetical protein
MKGKLLFEEEQSFTGTWLWNLSIIMLVGFVGLFGWGMYQQLVQELPWGDHPMSDLGLIITSISSITVMFGIVLFLSIQILHMKVDEGSIQVKFYPYTRSFRQITKNEIQQASVRSYHPIMEFGGWGYRAAFKKNMAYNISGNRGLQLIFNNGKKLLIGTKKEAELKAAISKFNEAND